MSYQSKFTGAEIDAGIDAANAALPKNGGTMMGALILAGDPAEDKAAVTKKYVDDAVKNIASTPGNDGEDGVSPTISVTEITGGHRITITDANGTQSFDIMNGKDGADGSGGDGSGDMLKAVYDADNDGTVDNAAKLGGKAASEYYGKENPPPYPVTSVNGMTGDVVITGGGGSGDMQKAVYDIDGSGIVDDSERLGGKLPEEYALADHVHDWNETASVGVGVAINIPSGAKDILICAYLNNDSKTTYQTLVSASQFTSQTHTVYLPGYLYEASDYGYASVKCTSTNITLNRFVFAAATKTDAKMKLIYR